MEAGFPLHIYDGARFVHGHAEAMPLPSSHFDVVISVNAIDHVDDLSATVREIRRVLKPEGALRLHVHYHARTRTEPIEINDRIMGELFGWRPGMKKLRETDRLLGSQVEAGETFALWGSPLPG